MPSALLLVLLALPGPTRSPAGSFQGPRAALPEGWEGFPALVWREDPGTSVPPGQLEPFGGVVLLRGEDGTWAHERGLATLLWNAPGRDALHLDADAAWRARVERWCASRDPALLARTPCLSDPRTVAVLETTLTETLERHAGRPTLGVVLGDEVALTPAGAPFDACRSPACEAAWRAWAAPRGWPERAPGTDEARHALAGHDGATIGAWLARRRFDRERLAARLEGLAASVRARGLPVALLGCGGTTPFGGLDLAALADLDITEAYPRGDARALERRHAGAAHLTTLFPLDETPDGAAWGVLDAWARGDAGVVLWSDRVLDEPLRRARLLAALTDVRRLAARADLAAAPPAPALALLHDPDSIAAGWLRAHAGDRDWVRALPSAERRDSAFGRKVERWEQALTRRARPPTAVTLAPADAGRLAEVRVLVLIEPLVLDAQAGAALEAFLDRGGVLAIDAQPGAAGWIDRRGARTDVDWVERLAGRAPGRVLVRDSDALPLDERWLATLEAAARLEPLPLPRWKGAGARLAWRRSAVPLAGGPERWRVVLWPDRATPRERERLAPVALDLEPPAGWTLERVHPPPPQTVLPAGDAAVLVLTRTSPR